MTPGNGPGRPPCVDGGTKRRQVTIDDKTAETMCRLGKGNLSRGIRVAATKIRAAIEAARKREE